MQRLAIAAVLLGGALLSQTALGQQAAPAPVPDVTQQGHDDPNEIICRPAEPILGSRLPGPRLCRTRREWDQLKRDSASVLFHEQMERSSNCAGKNSLC